MDRVAAMRTVILPCVVAIRGCRSTTGPGGTLSGDWISTADSTLTLTLHLSENGDTLTGNGTYAVTGGRSGTFLARGDRHSAPPGPPDGPTINLIIAPDTGSSSSFVGSLDAPNRMVGILLDQHSSKADSLIFVRQ